MDKETKKVIIEGIVGFLIVCMVIFAIIKITQTEEPQTEEEKIKEVVQNAFNELPYTSFRICKIKTGECITARMQER